MPCSFNTFVTMKDKLSFYKKYKQKLEENGVGWKPVNVYNLELLQKIELIAETLELLKETIGEESPFISKENLDTYLADTFIVTAKLCSCMDCELYIIYMENASVVRYYMKQLETYVNGMDFFQEDQLVQTIDKYHLDVLRDEVRSFKSSFIEWTKHFIKDDYEDEWNLY